MCLIMTIIAALVSAGVLAARSKRGMASKSLVSLTLAYASAALMWCVDGIASVMEGEGFFDISMEDTILGAIIVFAGLLFYAVLCLFESKKKEGSAA